MDNRIRKVSKKKYTDAHTKREFYYMSIGEACTVRPYVTQQHWTTDGLRFVVGYYGDSMLYEYNILTEELFPIDNVKTQGSCDAVVSKNNRVYYRNMENQIKMFDLDSREKQLIANPPEEMDGIDAIGITEDEKYLSCYWSQKCDPKDYFCGKHRLRVIPRLDCKNGIWDYKTLHHEFDDENYPSVGHPMINPKDPNLIFFCHEGMTLDIKDRLWIADYQTKEHKNLFLQSENKNGTTGEPSGHEVWSADGEYMYFVKFLFSQTIGKSGIVRINKDGSFRRYINDDYLYWHCFPSSDNNWVVADTQIEGGRTEIVLVDVRTEKSLLLCNIPFAYKTPQHPYQPHPVISPDCRKVSWQMIDESGVLGCAWMDISDITLNAEPNSEKRISDKTTIISFKNTVSEVSQTMFEGEACFRVPYKKALFVKADDCGANSAIKLKITFFDWGKEPVVITYKPGTESKYDCANLEDRKLYLERTHSCSWVTKEINIDSINLDKPCKFGTDLYVCGHCSETHIKLIEISDVRCSRRKS